MTTEPITGPAAAIQFSNKEAALLNAVKNNKERLGQIRTIADMYQRSKKLPAFHQAVKDLESLIIVQRDLTAAEWGRIIGHHTEFSACIRIISQNVADDAKEAAAHIKKNRLPENYLKSLEDAKLAQACTDVQAAFEDLTYDFKTASQSVIEKSESINPRLAKFVAGYLQETDPKRIDKIVNIITGHAFHHPKALFILEHMATGLNAYEAGPKNREELRQIERLQILVGLGNRVPRKDDPNFEREKEGLLKNFADFGEEDVGRTMDARERAAKTFILDMLADDAPDLAAAAPKPGEKFIPTMAERIGRNTTWGALVWQAFQERWFCSTLTGILGYGFKATAGAGLLAGSSTAVTLAGGALIGMAFGMFVAGHIGHHYNVTLDNDDEYKKATTSSARHNRRVFATFTALGKTIGGYASTDVKNNHFVTSFTGMWKGAIQFAAIYREMRALNRARIEETGGSYTFRDRMAIMGEKMRESHDVAIFTAGTLGGIFAFLGAVTRVATNLFFKVTVPVGGVHTNVPPPETMPIPTPPPSAESAAPINPIADAATIAGAHINRAAEAGTPVHGGIFDVTTPKTILNDLARQTTMKAYPLDAYAQPLGEAQMDPVIADLKMPEPEPVVEEIKPIHGGPFDVSGKGAYDTAREATMEAYPLDDYAQKNAPGEAKMDSAIAELRAEDVKPATTASVEKPHAPVSHASHAFNVATASPEQLVDYLSVKLNGLADRIEITGNGAITADINGNRYLIYDGNTLMKTPVKLHMAPG